MAVAILYTTTDAIRSAIGTDESDIDDTILLGQDMELQMTYDLVKLMPDHEDQSGDELVEMKLKLWCMWYGALRLAESPLAIPKALGTGKDEFLRFEIDWEALRIRASGKLAELTKELVPAYTSFNTVMGKATPDYNPIEGF